MIDDDVRGNRVAERMSCVDPAALQEIGRDNTHGKLMFCVAMEQHHTSSDDFDSAAPFLHLVAKSGGD